MDKTKGESIMQTRRTLATLLALLPCRWAWSSDRQKTLTPPFSVPFAMDKAGNELSFELKVDVSRSYRFQLKFYFEDHSAKDRLLKVVGGPIREPSGNIVRYPYLFIPLKFRIDSLSSENDVHAEADHVTNDMSVTSTYIFRVILYVILKPGRYRVSVQSSQDISGLAGADTRLAITYNPKA